ncbi:MAG TPA: acetolactate decarboxylase, partial [Longimicrobium sp.]
MRTHPFRAALLLGVCTLGACASAQTQLPRSQTIWQLSPVATFRTGEYDAAATVGEVRSHGNMGLGAAAALDGEMLLLNGQFWRFAANGQVLPAPDALGMPFAQVTEWRGGTEMIVPPGLTYADSAFQRAVDVRLPGLNAFYALRMHGTFDLMVSRTYTGQVPPYIPLSSAPADTFRVARVTGTMVGFRAPQYADPVTIPGYHLHFIADDR